MPLDTTTQTFELDTSGEVALSKAAGVPFEIAGGHEWSDLDPFTQGYVEAVFAGLSAHLADQGDLASRYGDKRPASDIAGFVEAKLHAQACIERADALGFSDLAPETLARIVEDCAAGAALYQPSRSEERLDVTGRTFWQTRQDGLLTRHPPLTAYLGDDGLARLREAV